MKKTSYFFLGVGALLGVAMAPVVKFEAVYASDAVLVDSPDELVGASAIKLSGDVGLETVWAIVEDTELDLNGKTLTVTTDADYTTGIVVMGGATLTIADSSEDATGRIVKTTRGNILEAREENSKIVLESGAIVAETSAPTYGVFLSQGGMLEMNGGMIDTSMSSAAAITGNGSLGDMHVTVNDGTVRSKYQTVYMPNQVDLNINGGVFDGGLIIRMGQVTITDGTINAIASAEGLDDMADYYDYGNGYPWLPDAITFWGGTTYVGNESEKNSLNVNISGGEFRATNGAGNAIAVYDVGAKEQDVNIAISGGRFEATGQDCVKKYYVTDLVETPKAGYGVVENEVNLEITGGAFSDEPAEEDIAEGEEAEKDESGAWVIYPKLIDYKDLEVETDNGKVEFRGEFIADRRAYLEVSDEYDGEDFSAENGKRVKVFDVTLNDRDGNEIEVKDKEVEVYIELSAEEYTALKEYDKVEVVYFDGDGKETERLAAEIGEVEVEGVMRYFVKFDTTHFSAYGVVGVDEEAETVTPNTGAFTKMEDRAERLADMVRLSVGMLATGMMLVGAGLIMRGRAYIERNNNLDK